MMKAMSMSLLFVMMAFMVTDAEPVLAWLTTAGHKITKVQNEKSRIACISSVDDPQVKKRFAKHMQVRATDSKVWVVNKPGKELLKDSSYKDQEITLHEFANSKTIKRIPKTDTAFLITLPPFNTAVRQYVPSAKGRYSTKWVNGAVVKYTYPYTHASKTWKEQSAFTDPAGKAQTIDTLVYDKKGDTGKIWYMTNVDKGAEPADGVVVRYNYHDIPFNKAFMEKQMGIAGLVGLRGKDICTVTWSGRTKKFKKDVEFKRHGSAQIYVVTALSKNPGGTPKIRYITKQEFRRGQPQTETLNADFDKGFLQGTATFHGLSAHREYRDVLSAFSEYVDLLEYDYDYELEGEIAREEEVIRDLKKERKKINRLKNRYRH